VVRHLYMLRQLPGRAHLLIVAESLAQWSVMYWSHSAACDISTFCNNFKPSRVVRSIRCWSNSCMHSPAASLATGGVHGSAPAGAKRLCHAPAQLAPARQQHTGAQHGLSLSPSLSPGLSPSCSFNFSPTAAAIRFSAATGSATASQHQPGAGMAAGWCRRQHSTTNSSSAALAGG
jgi:hypothetical protein